MRASATHRAGALVRRLAAFAAPVLILGHLLIVAPARAVSFDCARATQATERLICGNRELSALDDTLAELFESAHGRTDEKSTARATQRAWIARRNQCADATCIGMQYERRIAELACAPELIGSAIGANLCHQFELRQTERRLGALQERFTAMIVASVEQPEDARRAALAEARTWREHRDARCALQAERDGGAPGWKAAHAGACALEETRRRIEQLRKETGR